jgi:hypothetical protein
MKQNLSIFLSLSLILASYISYSQEPVFDWAERGGNSSFSSGNAEVLNLQNGDIFLCGDFLETAEFGDHSIFSVGENDIYITRIQDMGEISWIQSFGGADEDFLKAASTDGENVYVGVAFYGETTIGSEIFESMGSQDFYLAGFDMDGNFRWANHIGSVKTDYIQSMDLDSQGNILVCGKFYDDIIFGDEIIYSNGSSDFFIAKYNPNGELLWLGQGGAESTDDVNSINVNQNNEFYLTGYFYGHTQLGDSAYTTQNPTGVFLAKYSEDATLLWTRIIDGDNLSNVSYVISGRQDDVYLAGNFNGNLNLGNHSFSAGEFNTDVYAARFSGQGEVLWAAHGSGEAADDVASLSVDENNNLFIAGHYLMDITFGSITFPYTLCCGSPEIYVVQYSQTGESLWGGRISGERANLTSSHISVHGRMFVAGIFYDTLNIGGITIEANADYSNYFSCISWPTFTFTEENTDEFSIELFPNPASDQLIIRFAETETDYWVQLFDIKGSIIGQWFFNGSQKHEAISVSHLENGTYFLSIKGDQNQVTVKKVIISR